MALFGYLVEPNFDLGKEKRRDRLWWFLIVGLAVLGVLYLFHPFSRMVFIGYGLTTITYGDCLYVQRNDKLRKRWLWKTVVATMPVHLGLLAGIAWITWISPRFASTAIGGVGFIVLCFACEAVFFDWVAARLEPKVVQSIEPSCLGK